MNVFIRWTMKCSIQLGFTLLNGTFHFSYHANILTISLINIYYLHTIEHSCYIIIISCTLYFDMKEIQDQLIKQDADATRRVVRAAIITFKTLRDASIASQVLWQAKPYHTIVQPAPESRNIIWKNLEFPLWNRYALEKFTIQPAL